MPFCHFSCDLKLWIGTVCNCCYLLHSLLFFFRRYKTTLLFCWFVVIWITQATWNRVSGVKCGSTIVIANFAYCYYCILKFVGPWGRTDPWALSDCLVCLVVSWASEWMNVLCEYWVLCECTFWGMQRQLKLFGTSLNKPKLWFPLTKTKSSSCPSFADTI